jgi:hypothetical protein
MKYKTNRNTPGNDEAVIRKPLDRATGGDFERNTISCLFNGQEISNICVEADAAEGWADVLIFSNGRALIGADENFIITRIHGTVQITLTQRTKQLKI